MRMDGVLVLYRLRVHNVSQEGANPGEQSIINIQLRLPSSRPVLAYVENVL